MARAPVAEGDASLERVLEVKALTERITRMLSRVGEAADLGRAACACVALRDACAAADDAWERPCKARFALTGSDFADAYGPAAFTPPPGFSWRRHFYERATRGLGPAGGDVGAVAASLTDMARMFVDVWHGSALVFSAALSPGATEMLMDECYSDSDDQDFDTEWKAEFANELDGFRFQTTTYVQQREPPSGRRAHAFVDAGRLRASAWLLRRDGGMVRVLRGAIAHLDETCEGSVSWSGARRFTFSDGATPGAAVVLQLRGWLIEAQRGYRWWQPEQGEPRPPARNPKQLTRLRVRWEPAGGGR